MRQGACPLDDLDEYGCAPIHNEDDEACEGWREIEMPLEQRFQQLEQVARDMLEKLRRYGDGEFCCVYQSDIDPFAKRLIELGVSLDDRQ